LSPRSRLFSAGAAVLSPIELLSLCLGGGRAEADSLALAAEVLSDLGGLHGLLRSSVYDLLEVRGVGEANAAALLAAVELARRMPEATGPVRTAISSPADVAALLRGRIAHEDREHFVVVLLNTKNRVIGAPTVSIGTSPLRWSTRARSSSRP
jgi:DNA repair protein RadC